MMDALDNWSDRTDLAMEQNDNIDNTNIDQGAAITASPASRVFNEEYFAKNFTITSRAIHGRNAYAAWARKFGLTKKDVPEFLRIDDELLKAGGNLDKVEPTLQYAAALQGKTTKRPRITPPPPPRPTGDARFNAGMLKDLFEMIADTSVNRDALVTAFRNSLPALRVASTNIDRSYIIFEVYCGLL
ncbi:hypothetical protein NPIL_129991 [Nephila pilipes]|uniref:Uncharacterized protein n=1 Tax=Nephila pilipes TaxID=299642 RepID=A0A8X6PA74_NEPPI|nr:hypothetical protein NPIL_129991 [Nephila pilipes]